MRWLVALWLAGAACAQVPAGAVEQARFEEISGWAYQGEQPATVTVQLDDRPAKEVVANRPRADHSELGGDHGFRIGVKELGEPRDLSHVRVRVSVGDVPLYDRVVDLSYGEAKAVQVRRRIAVLIADPLVMARGDRPLSEVMGWADAKRTTDQLIEMIRKTSGGAVECEVVDWIPLEGCSALFASSRGQDEYFRLLERARRGEKGLGAKLGFISVDAALKFLVGEDPVAAGRADEIWVWHMPLAPIVAKERAVMGLDLSQGLAGAVHAFAVRAHASLDAAGQSWERTGTPERAVNAQVDGDLVCAEYVGAVNGANWAGEEPVLAHDVWWLVELTRGGDWWHTVCNVPPRS